MIFRTLSATLFAVLLPLAAVSAAEPTLPTSRPTFTEVTVHDPAVLRHGQTWYVFGSHLAAAKSDDLLHWTSIGSGVRTGNPLIPNVLDEMKEALTWGQTDTFWAPDVIQLGDGKFYMYYCVCKGDSARSALGLAVADRPEGPYKNLGLLLKSGQWGQPSEDGAIYDSAVHPNVVDPDVFFSADGKDLWMVYGSYSGGIFILRLDPTTGRPFAGQGYGKKLTGGPHVRIEAPAILYHPPTQYYCLFLSYGGLASDGGYQIRVARSRTPDGPYLDALGQDMISARAPKASFFDDKAIEPFGTKLVGNFDWGIEVPPGATTRPGATPGYVSPGHNSAAFDPETGRSFVFMHSRFPGQREWHQVRVHELVFTEDGWPLMAPHRYAGDARSRGAMPLSAADLVGDFLFIDHGREISPAVPKAGQVRLNADGKVDPTAAGEPGGSWAFTAPDQFSLTLASVEYRGRVLRQWDPYQSRYVVALTGLSSKGTTLWATPAPPKPGAKETER